MPYTKIISWNLNGLPSCLKNRKAVLSPIVGLNPSVICFQEIRTGEEPVVFPTYHHFWAHSKNRSNYAGVLTMSLDEPLSVRCGVGDPYLDMEGRLLVLEFEKYWSVNAYFPNSQGNLDRLDYRLDWDAALLDLLIGLDKSKPVILCGDFNVTRSEIDVYPDNERQYWAEQGYMSDERDDLEKLIGQGFTDVFRHKYPDKISYTWWSNRLNKRKENKGWRLDYFLVSDRMIKDKVVDITHFERLMGSDHCPIMLGCWV